MAALEWGPADGKPVLALHGWLDNAASFSGLAPWLDGFRVVAPDLPGHGHSDHRAPGSVYHLIDGVADTVAILDALGWQSCAWLGHSMGGAIAALAAAAAPQRFTRLALLESLGPLTDAPEQAAHRLDLHLKDRAQLRDKRLPVYPDLAAAVKARLTAGDITPEAAARLAERGTKAVPGGLTWRSDPRLRQSSPSRLTEPQVHDLLAHIRCPTLVLTAQAGFPPLLASLKARLACIPGVVHETVAGGHHVHLDQPDRVGPRVKAFLEGRS